MKTLARSSLPCIIALGFMGTSAHALTAEQCSKVLAYGVHDEQLETNQSSYIKKVRSNFCNQKNSSTGFEGSYLGPYGNFGGSYNDDEASSFCSSNSDDTAQSRENLLFQRKINTALIRAWSDCVKDSPGLFHSIEVSPNDPDQFTYTLINLGGIQNGVSVTMINAVCNPTVIGSFQITGAKRSFQCHRNDADQIVTATLNSRNGIPQGLETTLEIPQAQPWHKKQLDEYTSNQLVPNGTHRTADPHGPAPGCEFLIEEAKLLGVAPGLTAGIEPGATRKVFTWWVDGPAQSGGVGVRVSVPSYPSPGQSPTTCIPPA